MNAAERALSVFRCPPHRYNCAQSVCAAFGREDLLEPMQSCGGGRAPEGTCGALYGAIQVEPALEAQLREAFNAANGATTCRQLKGEGKVPCELCVRTACELLEKLRA